MDYEMNVQIYDYSVKFREILTSKNLINVLMKVVLNILTYLTNR